MHGMLLNLLTYRLSPDATGDLLRVLAFVWLQVVNLPFDKQNGHAIFELRLRLG